jgi:hypothetical protein
MSHLRAASLTLRLASLALPLACLAALGCKPAAKDPCPPAPAPTASGPPPAPLTPELAQALQPHLATMAQKRVAGSHAIGPAFGAVLQQGQRVELPLLLEPQLCYSVLAIASGVTELDLSLGVFTAPGLQPLASDSLTGAQSQLGGERCVTIPPSTNAVLAQVVLTATAGAGPALAQIYAR